MRERSLVAMVLVQGLTGLLAGISIALPYVFLFYLLLGLLEDIGLLSRFIVNAERFLRKLGLPGKSFIPLVLGLGCTAPAIRATRLLASKKEGFHTATLRKSWIRMRDFVYIVMPLLMLGGIIFATLDIMSLTKIIVEPFLPITNWLGLPALTIIPLIFGFLQKDLTGAMLFSVLDSRTSLVLTPLQIYTFGLASTIGIPCIIALGMLIREFGVKKATVLTALSVVYALFFAGLTRRIILIF